MQTHSLYLQSVFCLHTIYFNLQKEYEPKDVVEESTKPKAAATEGDYVHVSFMDSKRLQDMRKL